MNAELLAALIVVESNGNDLARGRHGELGALQVRPCVVRDDQDRARTWHGGPDGWKRRKTVAYWKRVRARMSASLAGGTDPRQ